MVSSSVVMMMTEVVQAGSTSMTHIRVAKTKIASTRCWMMVRSGMPSAEVGSSQMVNVAARAMNSVTTRLSTFLSGLFF